MRMKAIADHLGYINVKDRGMSTSAADNTAAWNALVTEINATAGGVSVHFPAGDWNFTPNASLTPITVPQVHVHGEGDGASNVVFSPSADATCFTWDLAYARGGSLKNLRISSSDTTRTKVALDVSDASQFQIHNLYTAGFVGANSEGIRYAGREFGSIEDCTIHASVPIRLRQNPNHASLDADFLTIRRCYLLGHSSAPSSLTDASILIDDGVCLQNVQIEDVVTTLNQYGVYWTQGSAAPAQSLAVEFNNVRTEQMRASGTSFHLAPHSSTPLAQVTFINCVTDENRQGYYLSNCWHITKIGGQDAQTGTVLEQAGTCLSLQFIGHRGDSAGTVTTASMTLQQAAYAYNGYTLPAFAVWTNSSARPSLAGTQGSAAPVSSTHVAGDIVWNSAPTAGGGGSPYVGWVCVTGGTPGTWKTFGAISA